MILQSNGFCDHTQLFFPTCFLSAMSTRNLMTKKNIMPDDQLSKKVELIIFKRRQVIIFLRKICLLHFMNYEKISSIRFRLSNKQALHFFLFDKLKVVSCSELVAI
jgi:hypothetical protein